MQYRCFFCDIVIPDVKAAGVVRKVECWLPSGKTSGAIGARDLYMYAHRVCAETGRVGAEQQSLF